MITPSFSLTATERVLPKLALDFTTASLDPRVTFTRTTNATNPATYINSNGLITAATNNQPRFDYTLNTGGACKGLLIEESRANLLSYSEQFDDAYWEKTTLGTASAPVVTQNAGVAPDGTTTAEQIDFSCGNTVSDRSILRKVFTISNTTAYAGTVYIKAATAGDVGKTVRFRTENVGPVVTVTLTSAWQRVASNGTSTSTTCSWYVETRGTLTSQTASVLLWGAQFEAGAFETSYIPTTSAALTRNADVATMTGTNFSDWYNASEGAFYVKGSTYKNDQSPARVFALVKSGSTSGYMSMKVRPSTLPGFTVVNDAGASVVELSGSALASNAYASVVASYKTDSFLFADRGATPATDTAGAIPTNITSLGIGYDLSSIYLNGYVAKIMYWPMQLTNAEVQAFSKQ